MTIEIKAIANDDDVLLAWRPNPWKEDWVGFQVERKNEATNTITLLNNRLPPEPGEAPVADQGISTNQSPFRRCIWVDHSVTSTDKLSYRVTAMTAGLTGSYITDPSSASEWSKTILVSGDASADIQFSFNRGTLMSQIVSRFVKGKITEASLRDFLDGLSTPGNPARRYLSGDLRHHILTFLSDADRRKSIIYGAIYEFNDPELADALKPFGNRAHLIIGNGKGTDEKMITALGKAKIDIHRRNLSGASVHNKFIVEVKADGSSEHPSRVLTGSTNWTTTGLCTQLNNTMIIEREKTARRFRDQWSKLVAAGNSVTAVLKAANATPTEDGDIATYFAATPAGEEFKPVLDLIKNAKQGILCLMFMPGESPLLEAILDRASKDDIYVRGVVSRVTTKGEISNVAGEVIKSGQDPKSFKRKVVLPKGIGKNKPSWEDQEFNVQEMLKEHIIAIVHSKTIVVDPFSEDCAVITGSHNFSPNASKKNDENLVIIRRNQTLAKAYAVHCNGVYDHYSWRVYLANGGDGDAPFKSLDSWKPDGGRSKELGFWMQH